MKRVLVVDDDRETVELLSNYLKEGHTVQTATDAETALHRLKAWKPHIVILDINMPKVTGLQLVPRIRALTPDNYTPVVLITGNTNMAAIEQGLEGGADDYLTKPFRMHDLMSRVHAMIKLKEVQDLLRRANQRIEELSSTDDLTGLMNIRTAFRRGEDEIMRSRRAGKSVSALLINLDGFSDVNQNYGFATGSRVLQEVADRIKHCIRPMDTLARVGADEFLVLLCETDLASAAALAEKLRLDIQSNQFKDDKQIIKITATIGVASLGMDITHQKMSDLLHITSEALRSAKANGVDRVEIYSFS